MTKKNTTPSTPVAIVSLSIERDLLTRLDIQADSEDRTRSKMIARMIEFYLDRKHFEAFDLNVPKAR